MGGMSVIDMGHSLHSLYVLINISRESYSDTTTTSSTSVKVYLYRRNLP
jgi:hypothetical protein